MSIAPANIVEGVALYAALLLAVAGSTAGVCYLLADSLLFKGARQRWDDKWRERQKRWSAETSVFGGLKKTVAEFARYLPGCSWCLSWYLACGLAISAFAALGLMRLSATGVGALIGVAIPAWYISGCAAQVVDRRALEMKIMTYEIRNQAAAAAASERTPRG